MTRRPHRRSTLRRNLTRAIYSRSNSTSAHSRAVQSSAGRSSASSGSKSGLRLCSSLHLHFPIPNLPLECESVADGPLPDSLRHISASSPRPHGFEPVTTTGTFTQACTSYRTRCSPGHLRMCAPLRSHCTLFPVREYPALRPAVERDELRLQPVLQLEEPLSSNSRDLLSCDCVLSVPARGAQHRHVPRFPRHQPAPWSYAPQ